MNKRLKIYIIGILILLGAIVFNVLLGWLQMPTWYDVLQASPYGEITSLEWIVLVFVYPFVLGYLSYILVKKIYFKK